HAALGSGASCSYTSLIPSLFLSCHRDHRYLHSFPTRRSSDLAEGGQHVQNKVVQHIHRQLVGLLDDLLAELLAEQRLDLAVDIAGEGGLLELLLSTEGRVRDLDSLPLEGELDRLVLLALLGFLDVSVPATQLLSHVLPRVVSWVVNLLFVPIDRELGSVFQFIDLWDVLRLNWSGSLFWFGKNPRNIVRRRLALDDLVPAGQQVIDLSGCLSRHFSTVFTAQANWS